MQSWHKLRKMLEEDYLADSLKGHISYFRTMFRPKSKIDKEDNFYTGIMYIKYDDEIIFKADNKAYFDQGFDRREGSISISPNFYRGKNNHVYSEAVLKNQIDSAVSNAVYYKDFREYLDIYINMDIKDALTNDNPVYRMLAILDKRVGKRTLIRLLDTYKDEPEWLQNIYLIRFENEGIIKD